ncbi:MAG: 5/3-nucleotidase [Acidimicrobiaceae bacterium]|nr:5/3-nucleotidase [Acidimicrobiaceae bacterium]
MRVLITNDDGVHQPGITALARAVAGAGYDTLVVAPKEDWSGAGAAIGPVHVGQTVEYDTITVPGLEDVPVYGIDGPPALCVLLARIGGFGAPPDVVVSGVNPGNNTGRSILHSGTVGAAMTASSFGVSGLAVSIGAPDEDGGAIEWETATSLAVGALDWLIGAPVRTILNLNVPNIALADVQGVRLARLAPFGTVRTAIVESGEGRLQVELRATEEELAADTDTALVLAGFAAVTPILGPRAAGDGIDVAERLEAVLGGPGPPPTTA